MLKPVWLTWLRTKECSSFNIAQLTKWEGKEVRRRHQNPHLLIFPKIIDRGSVFVRNFACFRTVRWQVGLLAEGTAQGRRYLMISGPASMWRSNRCTLQSTAKNVVQDTARKTYKWHRAWPALDERPILFWGGGSCKLKREFIKFHRFCNRRHNGCSGVAPPLHLWCDRLAA